MTTEQQQKFANYGIESMPWLMRLCDMFREGDTIHKLGDDGTTLILTKEGDGFFLTWPEHQ